MSDKTDVVVIGGGLAGCSAALRARARGKQVTLITRSPGATSVSSGAWDLGPIPNAGPHTFRELRVSKVWKRLYTNVLFDKADDWLEEARTSLEEIAVALKPNLKMELSFEKALCLPTACGRWRHVLAAQELQARGRLDQWKHRKVGFVASENWRLRPDLLVKAWTETAKKLGHEVDLSPCYIDFRLPGGDWPLPHLAARLKHDEATREGFRRALEQRLHGTHFDQLIFPPLFLDEALANAIASEFHVVVSECLGTNDPVAGQRLSQALMKTLVDKEISVLTIAESAPEIVSDSVENLRVRTAEGWRDLKADNYILASGKFFGGGIDLGFSEVRELAFNLAVFTDRKTPPVKLRSELSEQAWAKLGVWTNAEGRPLGANKAPLLRNVLACGSVVGGIDFTRENVGLGFMALSGRKVGDVV